MHNSTRYPIKGYVLEVPVSKQAADACPLLHSVVDDVFKVYAAPLTSLNSALTTSTTHTNTTAGIGHNLL